MSTELGSGNKQNMQKSLHYSHSMCKVYYRNCLFCEYYEELKATSNYYSTHFGPNCAGPESI